MFSTLLPRSQGVAIIIVGIIDINIGFIIFPPDQIIKNGAAIKTNISPFCCVDQD